MIDDRTAFIAAQTTIDRPPLVPEIQLHLATEITPIWQATEDRLDQLGLEPPFWAFAWPGSQLLARYILDHPETVRGRRVLDFACGNGLAAIACMMAGATIVIANDIDDMALAAAQLNARLNNATITIRAGDIVGTTPDCDLLISGDICYNQLMADRLLPWLRSCAARQPVWLADPDRPYAPRTGIDLLDRQSVPTTRELEDGLSRLTSLFRLHSTSEMVMASEQR